MGCQVCDLVEDRGTQKLDGYQTSRSWESNRAITHLRRGEAGLERPVSGSRSYTGNRAVAV